ncbi:winged helix-turn-helix domain-containing protein [Candidatus Poriferisodalis sp.]|uniref:winged helix-turn-helix domain-containing protein n=1 Tax=Candidatus Poriferisodalis sp. TaxID=3101277 RepID=UPI003C6FA47D
MTRARPARLSLRAARRLAIGAQGLAAPLPAGRGDVRHLRTAMNRMGLLQIDAVSVLARSHLLVLRARLGGSHDAALGLLERAAYPRQPERRELTEYWGHEASFVRACDWPLYRWRMRRGSEGEMWPLYVRFERDERARIDDAIAWLDSNGPAMSSELDTAMGWGPGVRGPWGTRSNAKLALGWLFWAGHVGVAARAGFTRRYDLIERVLPGDVLALDIDEPDAHRALLCQAAACLGIATADDLIDYHRLPKRIARARLGELTEDGALCETAVEGWDVPAYVPADVHLARKRSRSVLLSPFDPLVWYRPRAERLFGFHYRIEIYTPKAKRQYGYFVLPFLHDDALVARLDLRFDRERGRLEVPAAWAEPGWWPTGDAAETDALAALATELNALSAWCGGEGVVIGSLGNLAGRLRRAIA